MTALHVIEIEHGEFVDVLAIPGRIADILWPKQHGQPTLVGLYKKTAVTDTVAASANAMAQAATQNHWRLEAPSEEDWTMLQHIWRALPQIAGITQERFAAHREAFEAHHSQGQPPWQLHAEFRHPDEDNRLRRSHCRHEHLRLIDEAIRAHRLPALTPNRTPAQALAPGVIVRVDDMRHYLRPLGFALTQRPQRGAAKAHSRSQPASQIAPLSRHRSQEQWIIEAIRERRLHPDRLPKNQNGLPGIKAQLRQAAETQTSLFTSHAVFDAAWKRMKARGDLKDA